MPPGEGHGCVKKAVLKRQRVLGREDTKAAMKVLDRYCKKQYRHSMIFGTNDPHGFNEPQGLQSLGTPGHYHSEPFSPRATLNKQFTFESMGAVSSPADGKIESNNLPFTLDFTDTNLKEEIKRNPFESTMGYIWRVFKVIYDYFGIKHILLLILMILYALAGGYMFYAIEGPAEIRRDERMANIPNVLPAGGLGLEYECTQGLKDLFQSYERELRQDYGLDRVWKWDFWNAVFYSGTIFTTIGYGNISCRTIYGRIATCAYALVGVPLMLVVLNSLGKGLFLSVRSFWKHARRQAKNLRKSLMGRRTATLESIDKDELQKLNIKEELEEPEEPEDLFTTFPMSLALLTVFLYISVCSWLFCYWEEWDYATAFYFFFISLSTVGLGDEMPNHPKRACAFFLFFIIGLALVSMCISILQVKVENQYMAALQLIDQEHQVKKAEEEEAEEEEKSARGGEDVEDGRKSADDVTFPSMRRPDRLHGFDEANSSVTWRRRNDSIGSILSSVPDRATRTSSIIMSSPAGDRSSPMCPPTVLGVFMARSISTRRPTSIAFSGEHLPSFSRLHRRPESMVGRSHEDLIASPHSPSAARAWLGSPETYVEAPTGVQRIGVAVQSPRATASLAVITEDLDDEEVAVVRPRAPPSAPAHVNIPEFIIDEAVDDKEEKENDANAKDESKNLGGHGPSNFALSSVPSLVVTASDAPVPVSGSGSATSQSPSSLVVDRL